MIIHVVIAISTAILFLFIALILWRRHWEALPITRSLSLYMVLFGLWLGVQASVLGGWFVLMGGLKLSSLLMYGVGLLGFIYLDLTRRFIQEKGVHVLLWGVMLLLVGGQIALDVLQPRFNLPASLSLTSILVVVSAILWVFLTTITAEQTIRNYRTKNNPLHRNRLSYWAITLLCVLVAEVAYGLNLPSLGNILLFVSGANAAFVITTHRHPDIRLGILRLLSYILTTTMIVVIYALAYWAIQFIVQQQLGYTPLTAGVIMALLLAIIFRPLFWQIQKNIDLVLGQVDADNNQTIREYSLSISNILNMEQLATVSTGLISESFDTRSGMLFLVNQIGQDEEGRIFKLEAVPGGMGAYETPPPLILSQYSAIAIFLSTQHRPLIQYDIDFMPLFNSVPQQEKEWFSKLGMDVYQPIYSKGLWIGMLAAGPKETGVPYSEAELTLLGTLSDQTSVALENARLVEGILQINMQLEDANVNLERAKLELERLDKAKSDFISIASHELRTPLTVIQGYTQMLNEDPSILDNAYHKNLLEGITSGAERLHSIVESMLDVAKIDVRELQLAPVPIPIQSIIQSVCRTMTKILDQRKLNLDIGDMSTLRPVEVDRDAIQKVFYHLINNAVKYTPDGGSIIVQGRMLPRDNNPLPMDAIEIIVKDTGIGIDPEHQNLIFRKFFRTGELGLHSSGKTKFKGAGPGLGLAIAQGVVDAHGGKIWVESPGYDENTLPGSNFHVVLPVRQMNRNGHEKSAPRGPLA